VSFPGIEKLSWAMVGKAERPFDSTGRTHVLRDAVRIGNVFQLGDAILLSQKQGEQRGVGNGRFSDGKARMSAASIRTTLTPCLARTEASIDPDNPLPRIATSKRCNALCNLMNVRLQKGEELCAQPMSCFSGSAKTSGVRNYAVPRTTDREIITNCGIFPNDFVDL